MILQALKEYYDRKSADPESDIAPEGFEKKEIPFIVVIDRSGRFVALEDTREQLGKKLVGKSFLLPRSTGRSGTKGYATTFLLWDHIGYLFKYSKTDDPKDLKRAVNQHQTWRSSLESLPEGLKQDPGVAALLAFYSSDVGVEAVKADAKWEECTRIPSCNSTFRLSGETEPIPCSTSVRSYQRSLVKFVPDEKSDDDIIATCLITGERDSIARTHSRTPINKDTKSLVSFQKNSGYDSYGKEQGYNAPISKSAEFAYTTALNTLLKSSQKIWIGDSAVIFWSSRQTRLESDAPDFFNEPPKDDPDRSTRAVADLLQSVKTGAYAETDKDTRFYVLGLSPNSARISVRFWKVGTVSEMAEHFARHFKDIEICRGKKQGEYLSLFRLLVSTAALGKSENIPPNLAGETMRAVLEGIPYPQTLLQAVIRRIRAEHDITYPRAALIKGCLNRLIRRNNHEKQEEIKVSLDPNNMNIGYRLGRLFATLEKIQSEASPGLNATIRDKFYGSASSSPVTVFGNLMRIKNHHLAKLENSGRRVNMERLIGEIVCGFSDFPSHLKLEDQGRFAIGYYHQMNDFYTKKEN
jgi:CRISPR-associated protein Csd1